MDAYVKDTARSAQQTQQVKLLQASAASARASLDFGVVLTDGLGSVSDGTLFPGLRMGDDMHQVRASLKLASARLGEYSRYVATAEATLGQDWGEAVAQVVASARSVLEKQCKTDAKCTQLMDWLSRYSGLFSALISEKDPEKVAQALDAAAMPIGGWRMKQVDGAGTLSLTAFPGFMAGIETRWGQYGVVKENGNNLYAAPFTLQLPFGLDLSRGFKSGQLWRVPLLIDPAAYLNYDPDKQGRLPGAQVLSSLAPGLAFHVSLGESPFVASVFGLVRPNFRAWESDVATPAATVFQAGVSLGVDVTLFGCWADRP